MIHEVYREVYADPVSQDIYIDLDGRQSRISQVIVNSEDNEFDIAIINKFNVEQFDASSHNGIVNESPSQCHVRDTHTLHIRNVTDTSKEIIVFVSYVEEPTA